MTSRRTKALLIHQRLLDAYGEPFWRTPLPALNELISTILSQNTNDVNRDRAFERLRQVFPTWEAVRDAPAEEVIGAVRVAGLSNQKGPRIQNVLRQITAERGDLDLAFLADLEPAEVKRWLLRFKGVGPKTAAIVMQFALNMPAFPVDTHIYRLSGRLGLREPRISADRAHVVLGELFPPETYYAAHLNIIRHGREICQARKPRCSECFLNDLCPYPDKTT